MKRTLAIALVILALLFFLPAERIVLRLVANIPVQTYRNHDTFSLDLDEKNVSVEVFGAELIGVDLYRATDPNVTLKLTKL